MSFWYSTGLTQYLCLAVMGGLTARRIDEDLVVIAGGVFAGLTLAVIGSFALAGFLYAANHRTPQAADFSGTWVCVNKGFVMLLPFTALALLAELVLDWSAVQVFTSAGIMIAGATTGIELSSLGKRSIIGGLLPTAGAFALSAVWMVLSALSSTLYG